MSCYDGGHPTNTSATKTDARGVGRLQLLVMCRTTCDEDSVDIAGDGATIRRVTGQSDFLTFLNPRGR